MVENPEHQQLLPEEIQQNDQYVLSRAVNIIVDAWDAFEIECLSVLDKKKKRFNQFFLLNYCVDGKQVGKSLIRKCKSNNVLKKYGLNILINEARKIEPSIEYDVRKLKSLSLKQAVEVVKDAWIEFKKVKKADPRRHFTTNFILKFDINGEADGARLIKQQRSNKDLKGYGLKGIVKLAKKEIPEIRFFVNGEFI